MLFDFFKKHEMQSDVREHLGGFQDGFTGKQKKAIMCSLFTIANSDGEYHRKEAQFFEQTASLLGYRLHSGYLDKLISFDPEDLFSLLNSLDEGQKDWYIITVVGMIHADGIVEERESKYMQGFFDRMGITEQRFNNVLKKTELLMKKFM